MMFGIPNNVAAAAAGPADEIEEDHDTNVLITILKQ